MSYHYLLDLALILISTKVFGLVTRRFQLPQVVGALVAGLVFGPACLGWLSATDFLSQVSELGVIVIMFTAGVGTDLKELRQTGKAGMVVAACGVLVPLAMGAGLMALFNRGALSSGGPAWLQNIFLGTVLTATSVSITVETLKEIGKLSTKAGNTILAAALIDDVLGLICLTIVTSFAGEDVSIAMVLLKIVAFFIFAGVVGVIAVKLFRRYDVRVADRNLRRFPIAAFVLCLVMAYAAEELFGVADIIGAFAAGLMIANTPKAKYIESKFSPLSYLLLTPVFFASIGIKVELPAMTPAIVLFALLLAVVAILSKIVGCGLGARVCGFQMRQCLQIGCGMACRGEVALIVANKGMAMGLISPTLFGPIIIMVVCCAVFTPIMLKAVFRGEEKYAGLEQSGLADSFDMAEQMDIVSEKLIRAEKQLRENEAEKR